MILVRLMGGLGNQMFQYAFGRYLAFQNNTTLKIDLTLLNGTESIGIKRDYALNIFNIKAEFATPKEIIKYNGKPDGSIFDRAYYKIYKAFYPNNLVIQEGNNFAKYFLNIKSNTCIVGRWQSYQYFEPISDIIICDFKFKNPLPIPLRPLVKSIQSVNSVSIHIRRTDYISNNVYANGIGPLPLEYYFNAVKKIESKIENPFFFIFSDDIEWCKLNLKFLPEPTTYINTNEHTNSTEFDLHLMTLCKHHIISNSTFAWWGAWLNKNDKGVVIAPSRWAKSSDYDAIDIIPENWIKI